MLAVRVLIGGRGASISSCLADNHEDVINQLPHVRRSEFTTIGFCSQGSSMILGDRRGGLTASNDNALNVRHLTRIRRASRLPSSKVRYVVFSPCATRFATVSDDDVTIWNANNNR
jgi:hypothetical protein